MARAGLSRWFDRLGLTLLGILLFSGYAMRPGIGLLPYVSLVPWTLLYSDPRRGKAGTGWFVFAAWITWVLSHQATFRFGWWAPFLMGLYFTPVWWVFPPLFRALQRLALPRTVTLPLAWVTVEFLRATFVLGHFDVFLIGYSQARFVRLAQIAEITGVYGLSFLLAAINGLAADAWIAWRDGGRSFAALRRDRGLVRRAQIVLAAFLLVAVYGAARLRTVALDPNGPRLAVIQPNVGHTPRNYYGVSLEQLIRTDREVAPGAADLVVWPENAILDDLTRRGAYLDDLSWLLKRKGASIVLGAQGRPAGRPDRTTNSAFLVDPDGRVVDRYDKQVLFPWTESVPLDGLLGRVAPPLQRFQRGLIRKAWGFLSPGVPGTRTVLFSLPWGGGSLPFGVLICVENTYPPIVAEAGRQGARFLVNITSEGTVSGVIQEQLLRVCMMRAIENRLAYVRDGNTGISAFIDPLGRLRSVVRGEKGGTVSVAGTLIDRIPLSTGGPTLYARSHDAFAWGCALATAALLLAALTRGNRARAAATGTAAALAGSALLLASGCGGGRFAAACPDEAACRAALAKEAEGFDAAAAAEAGVLFYEEVERTYPNLAAEARVYRALFLDRAGETERAAALYQELSREAPSASTWALLGDARLRLGDPVAAEEAFRRALARSPRDARVLGLLARARWEAGRLDGAREAASALLALAPDDPVGLTVLGKLEVAAGRAAEGEDAFRRAAAAGPKSVEPRYWLARLAWRDGRADEARRWLKDLRAVEESLGRSTRAE